jgi:CDGSH-type Zn-finger protein
MKQDVFPFKVEENQTYFFCACGKSQRGALCDGSHKGSGVRSIPFHADKTTFVTLERGQIIEVVPDVSKSF